MLNSYRPAYFLHTAGMFAFQPYMQGARQHPNPNGPEPLPFDRLLRLVEQAFREDYWALAEPRFPYAFALLDSLSRPAVRLRLLRAVSASLVLQVNEVREALDSLRAAFVDSAGGAGRAPVVLFAPAEPAERGAFDGLVRELRLRFGVRAVIAAVRDE